MIPRERFEKAIAEIVERSKLHNAMMLGITRTEPAPGDLYLFPVDDNDLGIEWLVVRHHPDDPSLVLLAPCDQAPFVGTPDVRVNALHRGSPYVVRCGYTKWLTAKSCKNLVGIVPEDQVELVRKCLADLVRGRELPQGEDDFNPEYEELCNDVAQAVASLEEMTKE